MVGVETAVAGSEWGTSTIALGVFVILIFKLYFFVGLKGLVNKIAQPHERIAIYFTQYSFDRFAWRNWMSFVDVVNFFFSWLGSCLVVYASLASFAWLVFGIPVHNRDLLLVMIAIGFAVMRFMIYKEGRSKVAFIPWFLGSLFYCWVTIGFLRMVYGTWRSFFLPTQPVLVLFFDDVLHFDWVVPAMPSVWAMALAMSFFLLIEAVCYVRRPVGSRPDVEMSLCSPQSVCFEMASSVQRFVGREHVKSCAKLILLAELARPDVSIKWINTDTNSELLDVLMSELERQGFASNSLAVQVIYAGDGDVSDDLVDRINGLDQSRKNHVSLFKSRELFSSGFMVTSESVMVTTFSFLSSGIPRPDIGFHAKDIYMRGKYRRIFCDLLAHAKPWP